MSYFMTMSGSTHQLTGMAPVELVPASQAQPYIRNLASELAAADGEPVYLVHDGTTGTSHDFIVAAGEHLQVHGSLLGTPFLAGRDLAIRYAPPEGRTPAAPGIHKP